MKHTCNKKHPLIASQPVTRFSYKIKPVFFLSHRRGYFLYPCSFTAFPSKWNVGTLVIFLKAIIYYIFVGKRVHKASGCENCKCR